MAEAWESYVDVEVGTGTHRATCPVCVKGVGGKACGGAPSAARTATGSPYGRLPYEKSGFLGCMCIALAPDMLANTAASTNTNNILFLSVKLILLKVGRFVLVRITVLPKFYLSGQVRLG